MSEALADRTFALLAQAEVPGVVALALPLARRCEFLRDVVAHLIPSRVVFYDAEFVYAPADLVSLLGRFAAATDWAWKVEDGHAAFDNSGVQRVATVRFRWRAEFVEWKFIQETDWVAADFEQRIVDFARAELPGEFIALPFVDQAMAFIYLEQPAAENFRRLISELPDRR